MDAPAKPKGRKRQPRKQDAAAAAAVAAAPAAGSGRPTATDATATEATEAGDAVQPKPSLSQRVTRSLKQLSQLGAGSKTEEPADEVEQQQLLQRGEPETEAAPPAEPTNRQHRSGMGMGEEQGEADGGEESEEAAPGGWHGMAHRGVVALRRRLQALAPHGLPAGIHGSRLVAAALLTLLLLAGLGLAARQARTSQRQLASLQRQLSNHRQGAEAARSQLQGELAQLAAAMQQLDARISASGSALEALGQMCSTQAGTSASLEAELAHVQAELAQLRLAAASSATAAAAAADAAPAACEPAGAAGRQLLQQVVREEVSEALELFAADRTGLPDYALAAGGAEVVAHSPAHLPSSASLLATLPRLHSGVVHPQASKLLLAPISQPGLCLPLVGAAGWVDVRLTRRIHPTAFTYEHIPAAIAFDIRSAPRNLVLTGFLGPPPPHPGPAANSSAEGAEALGVPLGSFSYDAHSRHPVQTFQLGPEWRQVEVDHVRLAFAANNGHPGYTCLYRFRMHGTPA